MVIGLLGGERDLGHEGESLGEVAESKASADRSAAPAAVRVQGPGGQGGERGLALLV